MQHARGCPLRRLYGADHERHDWLPHTLHISPKGSHVLCRNSGIYDMMPQTMQIYMDNCENKERGRVLKVLAELTGKNWICASAVNTVMKQSG